jgi:hypothetical protein
MINSKIPAGVRHICQVLIGDGTKKLFLKPTFSPSSDQMHKAGHILLGQVVVCGVAQVGVLHPSSVNVDESNSGKKYQHLCTGILGCVRKSRTRDQRSPSPRGHRG